MPASNVMKDDEHLQHSAHARFGGCGCHCGGHRCHYSGNLRAWSGNLDDDLGRVSRLFGPQQGPPTVLRPPLAALCSTSVLNHPRRGVSASRSACWYIIRAWRARQRYGGDPVSGRCRAGHSCRPMSADLVLSRTAFACFLMTKQSYII
jgi:hypothetical protein